MRMRFGVLLSAVTIGWIAGWPAGNAMLVPQAIIAGSFRRRPDAFRRLRGKRYYLVVTQELLDLEPKLKEIQIVNNVEIP